VDGYGAPASMLRPTTLVLAVVLLVPLHGDERATAVQQARAGNFTAAIPTLERLHAAGDAAAGADLVAVLTWANRPAEALAVWSSLPPAQRPAWVTTDAAHALGQLGGGLAAAELAAPEDTESGDRAAASLVRLIAAHDRDPDARFAAADRALAALDARLADARAATPVDAGRVRRLTFDRWHALLARERAAELVREFEQRGEPAAALPAHAQESLAGALLQLRRPTEAAALYRQALAAQPGEWDATLGLFYALIETEDFAAAYALIDGALGTEPAGIRYAGEGAPRDNPNKVGYAVTAALARLYGGQLADAWARLGPLAAAAPTNSYLRREAAAVMQARGWLDAATAELARASALAPEEFTHRVAQAEFTLARREFAAARAQIEPLLAQFPTATATVPLRRAWELAQRREFYLHATLERGDSPEQRGNSWRVTGEAWSARFADAWKAALAWTAATADIPEGSVSLRAPALALQRIQGKSEAELRVGEMSSVRDRFHASLRLRQRIDDHWAVSLSAARATPDAPLRALHYGLGLDTGELSATWSAHESRQASLEVGAGRFTSGNDRRSLGASWREKFVDRPHLDIDLVLDTSRQTNSRLGEPYYNPARVWDTGATVEAQHTLQRHYTRSWAQVAAVRLGQRDERGFGRGAVWSVRYELQRDFSDAASGSLAVATGRARYDGVAERFTRGELTFYARF